ncbi:glycosyltransferase family 4 protein [Piscinibacter sp.]|uniref:glycosyltransferase family 4 protein n=1 Tax=Piscinibacter sp. TaxID=1903157 RepID=UPI002BD7646C|nr:glycosyltransferase family 4 protein [Albitalea sp.]HUG23777.1 glycosyltransferase family 4 protein [Albitalea sp.]
MPAETAQLIRGLMDRGHEVGFAGDIPVPGGEAARHFHIDIPTGSKLAVQLREAVAAFAPDFVHVMAMSSAGVAKISPELSTCAWALTCHSIPPHERKLPAFHGNERMHYALRSLRFTANSLAWKWLFRRRPMPHVIVHSEWVRDVVVRYGYERDRTSLVSLGCEEGPRAATPNRRTAFPDGPRIVSTGGIAHTKGHHDAIVALAQVRRSFPHLHYQIIGEVRDSSYIAFLQELIERLQMQDCVRITPNLPHEQKQQALQQADLYVQPSHEEGFCLAYIEAAAIVPRLVGTDTGAIALVSEGDPAARVIPPCRPLEMAQAIEGLLQHTLPDDLMACRMQRLNERFSWGRYLDAHEALYRRLATVVETTNSTADQYA